MPRRRSRKFGALGPSLGVSKLVTKLRTIKDTLCVAASDFPVSDFDILAESLFDAAFLQHPSVEVRVLVACCLSDLLQVDVASDLFQPSQVKEVIFPFLMEQMKLVAKPNTPGYHDAAYLLENMANSKLFGRFLNTDDSNEFYSRLFSTLFALSANNLDERMLSFIMEIGNDLLCDMETVPVSLMQMILEKLVTDEDEETSGQYRLAARIISSNAETLKPPVLEVFTRNLPPELARKDWFHKHRVDVFSKLYGISKEICASVLPFLCQNMKSSEDGERLWAVQFYGELAVQGNLNVIDDNPSLWDQFLGRFRDLDISVRSLCVQFSEELILNRPDRAVEIIDCLCKRMVDIEENIREKALNVVLSLVKKGVPLATYKQLWDAVKSRTHDKQAPVRYVAATCLGYFYRWWKNKMFKDEVSNSSFNWIRDHILNHFYIPNKGDQFLAIQLLSCMLVPYTLTAQRRAEELFAMYCSIDEKAMRAMNAILKEQLECRALILRVVQLYSSSEDGSANQNRLWVTLKRTSEFMLGGVKAMEELKKFFQFVKENKTAQSQLTLMLSNEISTSQVSACVKKLLVMVSEKFGRVTSRIVRELLERASPILVDGDVVRLLMDRVEQCMATRHKDEARGLSLLLVLACSCTQAFASDHNASKMVSILRHACKETCEENVINAVRLATKAAPVWTKFSDKPYVDELKKIMEHKASPKRAKEVIRAVSILGTMDDLKQLLQKFNMDVGRSDCSCAVSLAAIGEAARSVPGLLDGDLPGLIEQVEEKLTTATKKERQKAESKASPLVSSAKFLGKVITNAVSLPDDIVADSVRVLLSFVTSDSASAPALVNAAATSILKFCGCKKTLSFVSVSDYRSLAYLILNKSAEVRQQFVRKVTKHVRAQLSTSFLAAFALAPLTGDWQFCDHVAETLRRVLSKLNEVIKMDPVVQSNPVFLLQCMPEYYIGYVLYLLAYYPDYHEYDDLNVLKQLKACISFAIKPLVDRRHAVGAVNLRFLRQLLIVLKQSALVDEPEESELNKKFWALCDLAKLMLLRYPSGDTDLPIRIGLPTRFLKPIPQRAGNDTFYLPDALRRSVLGKRDGSQLASPVPSSSMKEWSDALENRSRNAAVPRKLAVPQAHGVSFVDERVLTDQNDLRTSMAVRQSVTLTSLDASNTTVKDSRKRRSKNDEIDGGQRPPRRSLRRLQ